MRSRLHRAAGVMGFVAFAAVVLATAGCLAGYQRDVRTTGDAVVQGRLEALKEGVTTREQLIKAFGQPNQALALEDGREELIYVHKREDTANVHILFLLMWRSETERVIRYHFELKDGVLVNHWRDEVS